jgi:hypothetical protein
VVGSVGSVANGILCKVYLNSKLGWARSGVNRGEFLLAVCKLLY